MEQELDIRRTNLVTDRHTDITLEQAIAELASKLSAAKFGSRASIVVALCEGEKLETPTHSYQWIED